ncbi:MAG: leucine-rich repeat domain-containing protein [Chlamydiae bacterium]|nr:leucine-rich repeat domain-containing protein [Chlamydiota bacterium]
MSATRTVDSLKSKAIELCTFEQVDQDFSKSAAVGELATSFFEQYAPAEYYSAKSLVECSTKFNEFNPSEQNLIITFEALRSLYEFPETHSHYEELIMKTFGEIKRKLELEKANNLIIMLTSIIRDIDSDPADIASNGSPSSLPIGSYQGLVDILNRRRDLTNNIEKAKLLREWIIEHPVEMQAIWKLQLTNLNLTQFPEELQYFTHASWIDLSNNNIRAIPTFISKMNELTNLDLRNNKLHGFSQSCFEKLSSLTNFYVSNNPLYFQQDFCNMMDNQFMKGNYSASCEKNADWIKGDNIIFDRLIREQNEKCQQL